MLFCKNQVKISNGSISLISSFFTLCSKARVFEQWGLVTWKTHILREMRWSKEFSFTNICRFATWRVEGIFQAIRQRSRDLANMKRRYFTPLLLPIDALIVLKKISVILWQRVSHFLFLDTNRQCASYEKKSRMSWLLRCAVTRNLASQFGELFPPAVIYVSGYSKTHWVEKLIYVW